MSLAHYAGYHFAPMHDLSELRQQLRGLCREHGLRGTILLAPEGINFFVAGAFSGLESLLEFVRTLPGLNQVRVKVTPTQEQPYRRMLVRLKKEIVSFGVPVQAQAPRLAPTTLKQWLDQGKPLVLLDTRNDYEVRLGSFLGAHSLDITHFRDFPRKAEQLPESWKDQPIVTFCTGGIRCEKAAPWLLEAGFRQVWQLEGGILQYFQEVGGEHYRGECFVFDRRVGLDPSLEETPSNQCFACLAPLTLEEQADSRYRPGLSCPFCYRGPNELWQERRVRRQQALDHATQSLPGATPQLQRRPLNIPQKCDQAVLRQVLASLFPQFSPEYWEQQVDQGLLLDSKGQPADLDRKVRSGERFIRLFPAEVEPAVRAEIQLVYEDEALLVLEKPAPLPMHPCGRFQRNTLQHFLQLAFPREGLRPLHRLDANTSGLLLCARSRHWARRLHPTLGDPEAIKKVYLARVWGHPPEDRFELDFPLRDAQAGGGLRQVAEGGQEARTEFEVLARESGGSSLLLARLKTGRSHQIRVHLWQAGYPIMGDPAYLRGGRQVACRTLAPEDPPMQLHCHRIRILRGPVGEGLEWFSWPSWQPPGPGGDPRGSNQVLPGE